MSYLVKFTTALQKIEESGSSRDEVLSFDQIEQRLTDLGYIGPKLTTAMNCLHKPLEKHILLDILLGQLEDLHDIASAGTAVESTEPEIIEIGSLVPQDIMFELAQPPTTSKHIPISPENVTNAHNAIPSPSLLKQHLSLSHQVREFHQQLSRYSFSIQERRLPSLIPNRSSKQLTTINTVLQ